MTVGYGEFDTRCPKNDGGPHIFKAPSKDPLRHCKLCGIVGRKDPREGSSYFEEVTAARSEFFSTIKAPASAHGKPRKQAEK
jgi:hypothetical protein